MEEHNKIYLEDLLSFKKRVEIEFCNRFECTSEEALKIIALLENHDIIRLEAPVGEEKKATYLHN